MHQMYISRMLLRLVGMEVFYGNIADIDALKRNMEANCIPADIVDMDYTSYLDFLVARRRLMVLKIKAYYEQL